MPLPLDLGAAPEERVLRQLVSALLYEDLLNARIAQTGPVAHAEWQTPASHYRCRATIGAFGRVRVLPGTIERRDHDGAWEPARLERLVDELDAPAQARERLLTELQRTAALCQWNARHLPQKDRRALAFAELDSAIDEGHPYHPSFKARIGFDEADHRAYGPEAGGTFQLIWIAVRRDLIDQRLPSEEAQFWLNELGEATWSALRNRLEALALPLTSYGLMPLHPWQWNALKDEGLAPHLASGAMRCLGFAGDHYRASQSVRTLFNADDASRASVKLTMSMTNTSTLRTMEPNSVVMAPLVSDWLQRVVASDPAFASRYPLSLLPEYASVIADRHGPLAGQVAAIWRSSVHAGLAQGEQAAPLNALMALEADGKPFIEPWILKHGLSVWLDRFLDVVVLPVWHLLVGHGIATESHGQNMILVHRDGLLERLILRDFHDSVEYVPDFLADPAAVPDFLALNPGFEGARPNEHYWMESTDWLRELTVDCLFVFNLAEISHLLSEVYGLPEEHFWLRVRNRLARYEADHGMEARQARIDHARENLSTESLLARKLRPDLSQHQHSVPNMLATTVMKIAKAS